MLRQFGKGMIYLIFMVSAPLYADNLLKQIEPQKYKKGLLWKIESPQKKTSYLLGTMHIDHPSVWDMYQRAKPFFERATDVCTEVKMDFETMAAEMQAMFFTDGRTLKSVINNETLYKRVLDAALAMGLPEPMVANMKPFTLVFMLNMPESTGGEVLDLKIYNEAVLQRKRACGLETTEEHRQVFNAYSMEDQIKLLQGTIDNIDEVERMLPLLINAYAERDLVAMTKLVNSSAMMDVPHIRNIFIQKFLIDRNLKMAQRMEPLIKQGKAFFAVGAMHLSGARGLLRLLEERGYKLTLVY